MPLNIRIQWNVGTACVSECVLKTLACRGLRVGPSKRGSDQFVMLTVRMVLSSVVIILRNWVCNNWVYQFLQKLPSVMYLLHAALPFVLENYLHSKRVMLYTQKYTFITHKHLSGIIFLVRICSCWTTRLMS